MIGIEESKFLNLNRSATCCKLLRMFNLKASQRPRLRSLDVRPFSQQGQSFLLLSDPLQLAEKQLAIPQMLAPVLAYCDGQNDIDKICELFQHQYGMPLKPTQLSQVLASLDDAYMLDNERFRLMQSEIKRQFRKSPFRPPTLAGRAYPANPEQLSNLFDEYLAAVSDDETAMGSGMADSPPEIRGLLSPHIDYQRGGAVYAQVWKRAAAAAQKADLVIIFGTDHNGSDPFTLTQQNYATPYGTLPTPNEIVDDLAATIHDVASDYVRESGYESPDAYAGELRHRGEHSLELVLTWLHHMRQGEPCQVVPILVGGLHRFINREQCPLSERLLANVIETLAVIANSQMANGRNVLVVASGDLAHVGPAFGGKALDQPLRKQLRGDDQRLLSTMVEGDRRSFFEEICRVKDGNNVCGVSPIYLTMALLEQLRGPIRGTVTSYQSCPADETDTSVVTIGGVVFH